jgi:hypothetical protein
MLCLPVASSWQTFQDMKVYPFLLFRNLRKILAHTFIGRASTLPKIIINFHQNLEMYETLDVGCTAAAMQQVKVRI